MSQGLDIAILMKKVGAEQRALGLFKEHASVPAMRQVRRRAAAKLVLSGAQDLTWGEAAWGAVGKVPQGECGGPT
jgi:hypothetical protein